MGFVVKRLRAPDFPEQRGPTCGLYALEGVIRALHPTTRYRATKDHLKGLDVISLRHIAKHDLKITVIGEIFHATDLVALAKFIGLKAKLCPKPEWEKVIKQAIDSGKYVIAPFGVDDFGKPQTTGINPHWCVVFGYDVWVGGPPPTGVVLSKALVRHWGKDHWFFMKKFQESSRALKEFPQQLWGKRGEQNLRYREVSGLQRHGDKTIPKANLPTTLADKLVVVGKW